MIPNREGWHYPTVKKLSALLRGITPKLHGDFYCLNRFILLQLKTNFNCIKEYVEKRIFLTLLCLLKTLKY